jgi:hypothetical protein
MDKKYYEIARKIEEFAIMPVIKLQDAKNAEPLAEARGVVFFYRDSELRKFSTFR